MSFPLVWVGMKRARPTRLDVRNMRNAVDDELGLSFQYPCVTREVEQLRCMLPNKKWEWIRVRDSDEVLGTRIFFGDVKMGDFQIEGNLLRSLALYKDLHMSDFDETELANLIDSNEGLSTEIWHNQFYITNTSSIAYFDDFFDEDNVSSAMRGWYAREEGRCASVIRACRRSSIPRLPWWGSRRETGLSRTTESTA